MKIDLEKGSVSWICAALDILMYMRFDAVDGLSTFGDIVAGLKLGLEQAPNGEEALVELESFQALHRMAEASAELCGMVIDRQSDHMGYHPDGLRAALFSGACGQIVAIRGTGAGEWNDNAVAMLGRPQTNVYYKYGRRGDIVGAELREDYISAQQAQALGYFRRVAAEMGWRHPDSVTVTGHSKGGNKAQLIALSSPLIKECYSFCGQGFSAEAIAQFKRELGVDEYAARLEKLYSLSAYNDFVNVMGTRVVPDGQVYYFDTIDVARIRQYHELATIISPDAGFMPLRERGEIGDTAAKLWEGTEGSAYREAISMAVMTLCGYRFGNGTPINGEYISNRVLYSGGGAALGVAVRSLAENLFDSGMKSISEDDKNRISGFYETLVRPRAQAIKDTSFGRLVERALGRLRGGAQESDTRQAVRTGTDKTRFAADPNALRMSAERVKRARGRLAELIASGQDSAEAKNIADRLRGVDSRLSRLERHLAETADSFETADAGLAALARFVL